MGIFSRRNANIKKEVIGMEKDLLGINAGTRGNLRNILGKLRQIIGSLPNNHPGKRDLQNAQNSVANIANLMEQVERAANKGALSGLIADHKKKAVKYLNDAAKHL